MQYIRDRAWYTGMHVEYAGRFGHYEDKARPLDEKIEASVPQGTFMDYVSRRGSFEEKGEAGGHDKKNTGIFGRNGPIEGEALDELREKLQRTKSIIWHGVISPRREAGDALMADKEQAMAFMQSTFDRFLNFTRLKAKNVEWYAGFHDDSASGIKHIQFAFFEKAPHMSQRGGMVYTTRGKIHEYAISNAMEQFEEYFSGHREDLYIARDNLAKFAKSASRNITTAYVARHMANLGRKINEVVRKSCKKKEWFGYAHRACEPLRGQIDAMTNELLQHAPKFRERYEEVQRRLRERWERFNKFGDGRRVKPWDQIMKDLQEDIHARIGNSVIRLARHFAAEENEENWEKIKRERDLMRRLAMERRLRQNLSHRRMNFFKKFCSFFHAWCENESRVMSDEIDDSMLFEASEERDAEAAREKRDPNGRKSRE